MKRLIQEMNALRKTSDERGEIVYQQQIKVVKALMGYLDMPIKDIIENLKIPSDQNFIRMQLHLHFQYDRWYRRGKTKIGS